METNKIYQGDCLDVLKTFPDNCIDCVMTSPPYFNQRDYGVEGQLGLEETPKEYINKLCDIFDEVKRVLRNDGTCFVNIGDCYGGYQGKNNGYPDRKNEVASVPQIKRDSKNTKSLLCVPELFLLEMVRRRWLVRNKIIWWKPNVMPSSAKDRFTIDYEMLYFFVKSKNYFFETQYEPSQYEDRAKRRKYGYNGKVVGDGYRNELPNRSAEEFAEKNCPDFRNMRTVWKITTKSSKEHHFAMYPEELCETPIKAGCPERGIVLDPFFGAGTTGLVALKQNKKFVGIELNPEYIEIAKKRLKPYLEQKSLL